MAHTRVRASASTEQDELVPPRMDLVAEWTTPERINFELWIDVEVGDGIILAIGDRPAELAAEVLFVGDRMCATWRGPITTRDRTWLNAQRVRAEFLYFSEHS